MKIDLDKPLTRGATRTLKAFQTGFFLELAKQPFEKVTVNAVCVASDYPRGTFYNYFDDKFDLCRYCWWTIYQIIRKDLPADIASAKRPIYLFKRLFSFFKVNHELVRAILAKNERGGQLWQSAATYMREEANAIVLAYCQPTAADGVPAQLTARFYSDLIIAVLEWCLFAEPNIAESTAVQYFETLLRSN
ncbi:MAG: TetR/AcrR family transcriptional regulator [Lactobacillus sp.]|jgi:AcrR family transcriptional regulator|nr:TetR/AcrR family transcriptional regulator [Lactobacillus sp.]